jgi:hypothetical protein
MLNRGEGGASFGNVFTSQTPISLLSADRATSKAGTAIHNATKPINMFFIIPLFLICFLTCEQRQMR